MTRPRVLSIHQPNFIPWIGYFNKIARSDVFVILDDVQYPQGKSVANRNKIKTAQGALELVIPVSLPKEKDGKAIYTEVKFADDKWSRKALKTLQRNYAKAPYFSEYYPYLETLFTQADNFCKMNMDFIHFIVEELSIDTEVKRLSEIRNEQDLGHKNDLIIGLCTYCDADMYLSGKGAKKYNDEALMNKNGIALNYQEFTAGEYPQLYGEFIPNLSIIDALFNCGKTETEKLVKIT